MIILSRFAERGLSCDACGKIGEDVYTFSLYHKLGMITKQNNFCLCKDCIRELRRLTKVPLVGDDDEQD